MVSLRIAKVLSVVVATVGAIVMVGWVGDFEFLKFPIPGDITMKFVTAVGFMMGGIMLFFVIRFSEGKEDGAQVVIPITALIGLLTMATLLASSVLGIRSGIEDLFVKELPGAAQTKFPGAPSLMTMLEFVLMGTTALVVMLKPPKIKKLLVTVGAVIGGIAFIAVIGHAFEIPSLYFEFVSISNPIALITAILFALCGAVLILVGLSPIAFLEK